MCGNPLTLKIEDEDWESLGLSVGTESIDLDNNDLAIERNAAILENFLLKALQHSAASTPTTSTNDQGQATKMPLQLRNEIRDYVSVVCSQYHPVGFHSFEHASHVMLSASKLVSMLKTSTSADQFTIYDPWLHFAICFAALLHDVDHRGVPNQQLALENNPISLKYCSKEYMGSYAEWNSLEIGMDLLESDEFSLLRETIDNKQFRSVISDLILCTDIASQERRDLCKKRWKTTICSADASSTVADHIMQVADVSHTMQHFDTFLKWNERLYREILAVYEYSGKDDPTRAHPSENWYESQLGFFDFYVIPLAERLDASGVFENLDGKTFTKLAKQNRARWCEEGETCTNMMIASTKQISLLPPRTGVSRFEAHKTSSTSISGLGEKSDRICSEDVAFDEFSLGDESDSICSEDVVLDEFSVEQSTVRSELSNPFTVKSMVPIKNASKWGKIPKLCMRQLVLSLKERILSGSCDDVKQAVEEYKKLGSIRRHHGALLFVDVSGFTVLSQTYPIEDFRTFINEYFTKMIELIASFGGDVVKFAGDALYAIWTTEDISSEANLEQAQISHVEKCTACAIAITKECNDYKISKSYKRDAQPNSARQRKKEGQEHVLYSIEDKYGKYEERGATLNVYCGVAEGVMAGVDVIAADFSEFFLIGQPLSDVATAEGLAKKGELVISPSVWQFFQNEDSSLVSQLDFEPLGPLESTFYKVSWPDCPPPSDMLSRCSRIIGIPACKYCTSSLITDTIMSTDLTMTKEYYLCNFEKEDEQTVFFGRKDTKDDVNFECPSVETTQEEVIDLLSCHLHKATRSTIGQFSAELRRVIIIFVKIMYEPYVSNVEEQNIRTLRKLQNIFTIFSESVESRSGQVRQFISDDKGTVFIASFGLRGSMTANSSASAIAAAKEAQRKLLNAMHLQCSIGITRGKIFCGQVGSMERYEYSLLGPSVNLAARFMTAGLPGQINCSEEIMEENERRYNFVVSARHKLKGFQEEVPLYMPLEETKHNEFENLEVRKREEEELIQYIVGQQREMTNSSDPRAVVVSGKEGTGKGLVLKGVLQDTTIQKSTTILRANEFPNKEPFHGWIPVITKIILSCEGIRDRLLKMKKGGKHRSPLLNSLISDDAFQSSNMDEYNDLVRCDLRDYLFLVNDFVFHGFPIFNTAARGKVNLKDDQKSKKCLEVLTSLVLNFIERRGKPSIIYIQKLDCVDDYSKRLIQNIFSQRGNLIFLGGTTTKSGTEGDEERIYEGIFGSTSDRDLKAVKLDYFSKESTFDLFLWSLGDIAELDRGLLNSPEIMEKVYHICGGFFNLTTELARAFKIQWNKEKANIPSQIEKRRVVLEEMLTETPSAIEDLICFRFDQLEDREQMILKIASCAAYDGYSFSQDLLESVVLTFSRSQKNAAVLQDTSLDFDGGGIDVPENVGLVKDIDQINSIFQDDRFEQIIESLVEQNFLDELMTDVSDLASFDSSMYRFRSTADQAIVNGLMLDDQKKMVHFEVAQYYSTMFSGDREEGMSEEGSAFYSATDMTSLSSFRSSSWQRKHITALHYDLADAPVPAMLSYFDSGRELESLCIRDHSHGSLLSAYVMFERLIHQHSSLNLNFDNNSSWRQRISKQIIKRMGDTTLPEAFNSLTFQHLKAMFEGDSFVFKTCIRMLTKFGHSVGVSESDGYKFTCEIQFQAIYLILQVLENKAFENLIAYLNSSVETIDVSNFPEERPEENDFFVEDLSVSFPAFSSILTCYRSSPIQVSKDQETFTASLFVAITRETEEIAHLLRTKCTLLYLYKKHGEICRALEEGESVKDIYDHDLYSLDIVRMYGLDWPIICVSSMIAVYICRGEIDAAYKSFSFIETQLEKMDEFASSTKAIVQGWLSSFYCLLYDFESAVKAADGLSNVSYPYFYKPIGIIQDIRARQEKALYLSSSDFPVSDDQGILSILTSDELTKINHNRGMLYQSVETQGDRGFESQKADVCLSEIKSIQRQAVALESKKRQLEYCQAGLAHLEQSLQQKGAKNHDRCTSYSACLLQKAELLFWHKSICQTLSEEMSEDMVGKDLLNINGSEIDSAIASLDECKVVCEKYELYFRLLLVGTLYIYLGLDATMGVKTICSALLTIKTTKSPSDYLSAWKQLVRIRQVFGPFYRQNRN